MVGGKGGATAASSSASHPMHGDYGVFHPSHMAPRMYARLWSCGCFGSEPAHGKSLPVFFSLNLTFK